MAEHPQNSENVLSTPTKDFGPGSNSASPNRQLLMPSPIITRRTRTASTSDRAMRNPLITGVVKKFSRSKGHGFITPGEGGDDIFVHISDIDGEFIPQAGDKVSYRICTIPPKFEKIQAIHVQIINLNAHVHSKWDGIHHN